jgi:hypothetical protein
MHIETELDDIHGQRLIELLVCWQKPLPEVLAAIIDLAMAQTLVSSKALPEALSIGQWPDHDVSRTVFPERSDLMDTPPSLRDERMPSHTPEQRAALAYLDSIRMDWKGKPIPDRNALYDAARD